VLGPDVSTSATPKKTRNRNINLTFRPMSGRTIPHRLIEGEKAMADTWTAPELEELSIAQGTFANPTADDQCSDDQCLS